MTTHWVSVYKLIPAPCKSGVFKIEILSWWRLCGKALYKYGVSLIETNIDRNGNIVERNASPAAAKINELLK